MSILLADPPARVDSADRSAAELVAAVETDGTACVEGVVTPEWLQSAFDEVAAYLPIRHQELFIEDAEAASLDFVRAFVADDECQRLFRSVVAAACPQAASSDPAEIQVRIVAGAPPRRKPLWFHYDSSVLTVVVPIVIPRAAPGESGELILAPERRPYRRSAIANIVEKFVAQNDVYRRRFSRRLGDRGRVVPLEAGNAYLFWGYRSYHATLPIPADALRVTLVAHYGSPHGRSRLLSVAVGLRRAVRRLGRR